MSVTLEQPLSPRACAEISGYSYDSILRAIHAGHLVAFKPAGMQQYRVKPSDFQLWLYGHQVEPAPRAEPQRARSRRTGAPVRGSVEALTAIERESTAA